MSTENVDTVKAAGPETAIKPPAKRNRIQLSCTHCRHAKLKCDREKPCSQCVKRGRADLCQFIPSVARKRPAISMHNRLKHLESLVKEAMVSQPSDEQTNPGSRSHAPSANIATKLPEYTEMAAPDASGRVLLGPHETTYVGATHWAAMLEDIEEVKGYFSESGEESSPSDAVMRTDLSMLLSNTGSLATKDELLAALPERNAVNRLVSRYFNSNSPALHIIHKPTFQKNYRKFWANPQSSPISFLALIYCIICLGAFAALGAGEENIDTGGTPMETIQMYREYCAQCLALSNYAKNPGPYTLETFLMYMECEFVLSKGDQVGCYLIVGIAVRLALRMGLHRDSDNIKSKITPYQGEMRRRVWHLLVQMDLLVSFNNGLPSMVQAVKSDARIPLNLRDEDFDESSTKLPPSRPETEITSMSYTLAKGRLARVFGKVVEQANLLALPSYAEIMALDQDLKQAFSSVPPFFRPVPLDLCVTDSPELIIRRLSLAALFYSSQCILHRRYLMKAKENDKFSQSKTAAIDAARELLQIQSEVHNAIQPGGLLCKDSWIVSSLAMHDLLLAAVIIYLCLIQESRDAVDTQGGKKSPNNLQIEMIQALERSYKIWFETQTMSVDTSKAYNALGNMLNRLDSIFQRPGEDLGICTQVDAAPGYDNGESMFRLSLSDSLSLPGMSVDSVSSFDGGPFEQPGGMNPLPMHAVGSNLDSGSVPIAIIGETTDTAMDFDWDMFDNHVRQIPVNDEYWPDISFENFNSTVEENYGL